MILSYRDERFVCFSQYHEKEIPKQAGFRWDAALRLWTTIDIHAAARLSHFADDLAERAITLRLGLSAAAVEASKAAASTADVPAPDGQAYLPYQVAGIAYGLQRDAVLIADEPGLGKTIQAIGIVNATEFSGVARILIVCPATLRLNWAAEWRKWCIHDIAPQVVTDRWPRAFSDDLFGKSCAAIMSYEGAVKWKERLDAIMFDVAIFDEAHALKNPSAKRTRAIYGRRGKTRAEDVRPISAVRRIALTGTPIVNRPAELWPMVKSLDPQGVGRNKNEFYNRYVYENNLRELHDRMRAGFMVRRLKADVLKELPPKRRQMILIDPAGAAGLLAAENAILKEKASELAALQHDHAVEKLRTWRGAAMTEISRIRHETALKKVPAVIEHMYSLLDETEKVVLFVHHHDVSDALKEALPGCVVLDGRMTPAEKDQSVRRFQTDPRARVFIGSIRAAGMGITLTAASTVVFAELDWTPAAMIQAEDRCHRIGQAESVLVQHLVIDGSIDAAMSRILISKADMIGQILDGEVPAALKESILDQVLRR